MLGLSLKERLIKSIKRISSDKIEKYVSCLELGYSESAASKEYYNAVFDNMWQEFGSKSTSIDGRIRAAMQAPIITGLPKEYDLDYIYERGFDGIATYAFTYYGITGKPIDMSKDNEKLDQLRDYQLRLEATAVLKTALRNVRKR